MITGGAVDPIVSRLAEEDLVPWYKKPNLRALYLIMVPACLGAEWTSGFDSSMINGIQIIDAWEAYFGYPSKATLGFMTASYSLGCILALPFIPMANDSRGRKFSIVLGSVIMIIGAAVQGAAQSFAMFVIARMILGFGVPFALVAASALIGELSHPKERPVLTSLFNSPWFVGSTVAAGITYCTFKMETTWAWRIPSIIQAVPSILQLVFIHAIPESPRYLVSKGKHEEAREILFKYHGEGYEDSKLAAAEFAQIRVTIEMELLRKEASWQEFFTTPGNRRRALLALCIGVFPQWSGSNLLSFYLKKVLEQVGIKDGKLQSQVNLGMSFWALVNGTCMALVAPRFRRRTVYLTCITGIFLVYVALTVSSSRYSGAGTNAAGIVTIAIIFCYSPFFNMGFNALTYTYLVEIFPYKTRTKGITMQQWWGRTATFTNSLVNPIGLDSFGWKYYIWYCCWIVFEGLVIYLIFPETSKGTLEELAFLFEGDGVRGMAAVKTHEQLAEERLLE